MLVWFRFQNYPFCRAEFDRINKVASQPTEVAKQKSLHIILWFNCTSTFQTPRLTSIFTKMNGDTYKSTFLISNLHCPSCVAPIDSILRNVSPAPLKWSSSVVSQRVDVEHNRNLHI